MSSRPTGVAADRRPAASLPGSACSIVDGAPIVMPPGGAQGLPVGDEAEPHLSLRT
ncbi:hypothetical protein [Nonomuraea dietziae]|uniref:hypothetical protein n=1 Tax=Nonomuraea dietziae TaxID=65515 RepID=UPI003409A5A7